MKSFPLIPAFSRRQILIGVFVSTLLVAGCPSTPTPDASKSAAKPLVIATIPMIADLAREIAGDDAVVETLLNEGVDPHTYQPNASDIQRLTKADVVLFNGLKLEAMEKDLRKLADRKPGRIIAVAESIAADKLRTPAGFDGHPDPHVWMDVTLWSQTVPAITDALKDASPEFAEKFDTRSQQLLTRLKQLDEYVRETMQSVPKEKRYLVTAHDAFGYFSIAYDIEVASVQGVTTESQAGLDDVQRLVQLIVDKKIPAVFFESSVTNRNVNAVLEGAKAKGADVVQGGELFSDSAGAPGTWEGTYFGMIDHNVNTLATGLGGTVPAGGFREWNKSPSPSESPSD